MIHLSYYHRRYIATIDAIYNFCNAEILLDSYFVKYITIYFCSDILKP